MIARASEHFVKRLSQSSWLEPSLRDIAASISDDLSVGAFSIVFFWKDICGLLVGRNSLRSSESVAFNLKRNKKRIEIGPLLTF